MRDTVMLEGMPEPITLRLYASPADAPVPFSVYLPRAFDAEVVPGEEGWAVRFAADFANTGASPGWIEVLFHPAGTSEAEARDALPLAARSGGREERSLEGSPRFPWSLEERGFTADEPDGTRIVGTLALGRHDERLFRLTIRYPEEWGDGFGPRASLLLDTWRWRSGERLGQGAR